MSSVIRQMFTTRPFVFITIIGALTYSILNILINGGFVYIPILNTYRQTIIVPFVIGNLIIAVLVGLNLSLLTYQARKSFMLKKGGFTATGVFAGLMGGFCPGCFVGLFPLFFSFFGITASIGALPFLGLEILAAAIFILGVSTFLLAREPKTCKV